MDRKEHLLVILAEECSEISQEVAKALRFGLYDFHPVDGEINIDRIEKEFNQLLAVREMLAKENIKIVDRPEIQAEKINKVEEYLNYSRLCGTFQEYESSQ